MQKPVLDELDGMTRTALISIAKSPKAAVKDRIYALTLLKELDIRFIPQFGAQEELK